jgi:putative phage-type endonuclease
MTTEQFNQSVNADIKRIMQGTDEWFKYKIGKVGASRVGDVMAKGTGATRKNYMTELLVARLTGEYPESYTSPSIQWGIDNEPLARSAYEIHTGHMVREVGFIEHPTIKGFGASPDGLILNPPEGGLEIKCPNTATHLDTMMTGKIKRDYILQMQTGMACAELEWWDFVSFDPRLPGKLEMWIHRVYRDDDLIAEIEREVKLFIEELEDLERKCHEMQNA